MSTGAVLAYAAALMLVAMWGVSNWKHAQDLEMALVLYGFLGEADDELVEMRRELFAEVHHTTVHYFAAREIADRVDADLLRGPVGKARKAVERDWRSAFGGDE